MAVVPAKVSGHTFSRDNVHTYVVDCIIVAPPHAEVHTHIHTHTHTLPLSFLRPSLLATLQSPHLQKKLTDCLSEGLPLVVTDVDSNDLLHSKELALMLESKGKLSRGGVGGKKHKMKVLT